MVAGSPVAVQSPARKRFVHFVLACGRFASWSGVARNVARFSFTICHGGKSGKDRWPRHVTPQYGREFRTVTIDDVIRSAHSHRKPLRKSKNPFRRAAYDPSIAGAPGGAAAR